MPRILVVDDDRFVRRVIESNLSKQGYDVVTASDGIEGLQAVKTEHPDLIVTDKMMPNMNGFEFTRRIRREAHYAHIPILILTSNSDLSDKLDAFKSGADDYLSKPFEAAELEARITALMRRAESIRNSANRATPTETAHVIAVHSLRGGVGRTSLAVNLAVVLSQLWDANTLLLDLVLSSGQVSLMLNKPLQRTWADIGAIDPEEVDADLLKGITTTYEPNIHYIAAPGNPIDAERVNPAIIREARLLLTRSYDYVVADLSANFSETALDVLDSADEILLLIAPEMASVRAASIALETYSQLGYAADKVRLVLNQTIEHGQLASKQIEAALRHPISVSIPYAPRQFVEAINHGRPVVHNPRDPISAYLEELAFHMSRKSHRVKRPKEPTVTWERVHQRMNGTVPKPRKRKLLPFK